MSLVETILSCETILSRIHNRLSIHSQLPEITIPTERVVERRVIEKQIEIITYISRDLFIKGFSYNSKAEVGLDGAILYESYLSECAISCLVSELTPINLRYFGMAKGLYKEQMFVLLVMENYKGKDSEKMLRKVNEQGMKKFLVHLFTNLQLLHNIGFVHCDLGATNTMIYVDNDGDFLSAKIIDYECATIFVEDQIISNKLYESGDEVVDKATLQRIEKRDLVESIPNHLLTLKDFTFYKRILTPQVDVFATLAEYRNYYHIKHENEINIQQEYNNPRLCKDKLCSYITKLLEPITEFGVDYGTMCGDYEVEMEDEKIKELSDNVVKELLTIEV